LKRTDKLAVLFKFGNRIGESGEEGIGLTVIGDGSYAWTAAVLRTEPDPAYFFHFPVKFK